MQSTQCGHTGTGTEGGLGNTMGTLNSGDAGLVWFCYSGDGGLVWNCYSGDVRLVWLDYSGDVGLVWSSYSGDVGLVWFFTREMPRLTS